MSAVGDGVLVVRQPQRQPVGPQLQPEQRPGRHQSSLAVIGVHAVHRDRPSPAGSPEYPDT